VRSGLEAGISVDSGQTMRSDGGKMVRLRRKVREGGGEHEMKEL
jgi:hypothetical protein